MRFHTVIVGVPDWMDDGWAEEYVSRAIRAQDVPRQGERLQPLTVAGYATENLTEIEPRCPGCDLPEPFWDGVDCQGDGHDTRIK